MSPENFIYWLRGYFEFHVSGPISELQTKIIKDRLDLVLEKTPVSVVLGDNSTSYDSSMLEEDETKQSKLVDEQVKKFEEALKGGMEGAKAFAKIARGMMNVDNIQYRSNKTGN